MNKGVFIFWSIFIGLAGIRVWQSLAHSPPDIGQCVGHAVSGMGEVAADPERKEAGQVLVLNAKDIELASSTQKAICAQDILIRIKTKLYPRFKFNDAVSFSGNLSKPFNFKGDDGRSFDYQGYLAKDDVYYEIKSGTVALTTNKAAQVENLSFLGSISQDVSSELFGLKRSFVNNLENSLGEPHAALAAGLVVGEKSALGSDLLNDFRTVGLIHIVVLSGYNITVVADAMRRMLSFLPRVWGITIGGIGIAMFGILVGGGATVIRSCLMASIALSANLIRRDYSVTRALALAALVMLIQNPMILLHDPSFQLSFLATLGLVLLASPVEKRLKFIPDKFGMRGIIASTIATQIFVSPYILYMMGQLSIIGAIVNILVLPCIPATMLFVFLTGASGMVWMPLSHMFGWCAHLLLSYELWMVEHFARLPFAAVHIPAFPFWMVGLFYGLFFTVYAYLTLPKFPSIVSQLRLAKKSSM